LDPGGKEGVTNLMTSLLDEGSDNFSASEFKLAMRENGVKISYSASKEKINGTFQVVKSQIQEGFWLLHESLNKPLFQLDKINEVKSQIEASIKIDQSNISTIASDKFNDFFFINNKLGKTVKGNLDSLSKIKRLDILKSFEKSITKNNLVIGIAGDINSELAKKYIDYVFGNLPINNSIKPISTLPDLRNGVEIFEIDTPQTTVVFGQRGLSRNNKDYFSARIANYILGGGGFQSRLYKEIRERNGLVYSIYSYLLPFERIGIIIGGFQTRNENVKNTIQKVRDEWINIRVNGISKKELANAKTYFKGSFSRNLTSTVSIANLLMIVQYYDLGEDYFANRDLIIDNVKLNHVNKLVKNLFDNDKLFFMVVGKP
jgi:zinc protease